MSPKWSKNDPCFLFCRKHGFRELKIGVERVRLGRGQIEAVENWPGRVRMGPKTNIVLRGAPNNFLKLIHYPQYP